MNLQYANQYTINKYLLGEGMDPVQAVWGTMLDVVYLMPTFLAGGGTYHNPEDDVDFSWPPTAYTDTDEYPNPIMGLKYGNREVVLTRYMRRGYPTMKLEVPKYVDGELELWETILVHPDHLDAALCYLLGVPTNEA